VRRFRWSSPCTFIDGKRVENLLLEVAANVVVQRPNNGVPFAGAITALGVGEDELAAPRQLSQTGV